MVAHVATAGCKKHLVVVVDLAGVHDEKIARIVLLLFVDIYNLVVLLIVVGLSFYFHILILGLLILLDGLDLLLGARFLTDLVSLWI